MVTLIRLDGGSEVIGIKYRIGKREVNEIKGVPKNTEKFEKFARFRRRFIAVCLLLSSVYVVLFWRDKLYLSPPDLYDRIYQAVWENLYDRSRLLEMASAKNLYRTNLKTTEDAVRQANLLLKKLDDPFTKVSDTAALSRRDDANKGFYSGVGMIMSTRKKPVRVRMVMEESPALKAGIKPGDEILAVDDLDCMKVKATDIGDYTRKHMGEKLHFLIRRKGRQIELDIVPGKIKVVKVRSKIYGDIGYLRIDSFVPEDIVEVVEKELNKLAHCRALILDLRGNPGGSVDYCLSIASMFLQEGPLVTLVSRLDEKTVQTMSYTLAENDMVISTTVEGKEEQTRKLQGRCLPSFAGSFEEKPVYVLIDDSSASASEMLAAALHDNKRALLCGSKSFGKGVMQIFYPLPNSTALSITAGRYLTPSGRWLGSGNYGDEVSQVENGQKEKKEREKETKKESAHGLEPDILIEPKPEIEYGADDDNQLQSCLKLAQAKLTGQNQKVSEKKGAKQEDQGAR